MTYIPDYRKETDKLNKEDQAFIAGYRTALEDIAAFFDDILDKDKLTVEREVTARVKAELDERLDVEEIELVCAIFDNADYLPDDVELVDANREEGDK